MHLKTMANNERRVKSFLTDWPGSMTVNPAPLMATRTGRSGLGSQRVAPLRGTSIWPWKNALLQSKSVNGKIRIIRS